MAAHYSPAGHLDAGGDFYDVIPLDGGRLAMFIGDVMGRGVSAAAAMAQMRAAIRALVAVEPEPGAVLIALDKVFDLYEMNQLVTMVYAVIDPERDEVVVANAGHPPPLRLRADGRVDVVAGERGCSSASAARTHHGPLPFRAGDALLAFTDGLIERRNEDIETGVKRLAGACRELGREDDLFTWLADVVLAVRDTRRDDDVAVLAVRRATADA